LDAVERVTHFFEEASKALEGGPLVLAAFQCTIDVGDAGAWLIDLRTPQRCMRAVAGVPRPARYAVLRGAAEDLLEGRALEVAHGDGARGHAVLRALSAPPFRLSDDFFEHTLDFGFFRARETDVAPSPARPKVPPFPFSAFVFAMHWYEDLGPMSSWLLREPIKLDDAFAEREAWKSRAVMRVPGGFARAAAALPDDFPNEPGGTWRIGQPAPRLSARSLRGLRALARDAIAHHEELWTWTGGLELP
jgi:hypothetical protein